MTSDRKRKGRQPGRPKEYKGRKPATTAMTDETRAFFEQLGAGGTYPLADGLEKAREMIMQYQRLIDEIQDHMYGAANEAQAAYMNDQPALEAQANETAAFWHQMLRRLGVDLNGASAVGDEF